MKKWVFLDVMGVIFIVGDDTNDLLVPFIREINPDVSIEKINEMYIAASLGKLSSRGFWQSIGINDHVHMEEKYLDSKLKLDKHLPSVLKELYRHYNIGLISNDVSEWSRYLREKFDLNKYLNFSVISGDVGYRKPQRQIYEYALKQADCPPEECVFIDDRIKNLYPAVELGMHAIKFNRDENNIAPLDFPQTANIAEIPFIIDSIFHCVNE